MFLRNAGRRFAACAAVGAGLMLCAYQSFAPGATPRSADTLHVRTTSPTTPPHRTFHLDAAYCYAQGTPDAVFQQNPYAAATPDPQQGRYFIQSTWPTKSISWSFMPDGLAVDGGTNQLFARMDALFASQGGRTKWVSLFQACFDRWSALTGIGYTRVTSGGNDWDDGAAWDSFGSTGRGDVRIGMIVQDGPYNVMAYNYFPNSFSGRAGDMILDRDESWAQSASNFLLLRNVLMHEHGHGIGLQHVCPVNATKLMEPTVTTSFDGPQHDDIRAAMRSYGDRYEQNNSPAAATLLGTLSMGTTLTRGQVPAPAVPNATLASLELDGSEDFFRFDAAAIGSINIIVSPAGSTYDSSPQNSNGSCGSGNNINSLAMANLAFDLIAGDGVTVLRTVNATAAGLSESVTDFLLLVPGTYYVKVYETSIPSQPQMYAITVAMPDCNHNGVSDSIDVALGTSTDCNATGVPDECEINSTTDKNGNTRLDACEYRHGDFDLDGDTDMSDFGHLQACLQHVTTEPACHQVALDGAGLVSVADLDLFMGCLSGRDLVYAPLCN